MANGMRCLSPSSSMPLPSSSWQRTIDDGSIAAIPNGTDVTGRGRPDLLISAWSGGAHCCRTDFVFETRPAKLLGVIYAQMRRVPTERKSSIIAAIQIHIRTKIFAYWYGPFAGSPAEPSILNTLSTSMAAAFTLALDKMRQPAPSKEEWDKALMQVRNDLDNKRANMQTEMRTDLWSRSCASPTTGIQASPGSSSATPERKHELLQTPISATILFQAQGK